MRKITHLLLSNWLTITVVLLSFCNPSCEVSAQVVQADGTSAGDASVTPVSYTSSGTWLNRELGTPLRFGYHSEGYGTETGVVSLGSMFVSPLDDAVWFLDGQGTLSEDFGGGFNLGIGYREMVDFNRGGDSQRILGASFWTDGQSTKADNFFTALGFGLESLGESYDVRLNGTFPLSRTQVGDPTLIDFDTPVFSGYELFSGIEAITTDTAYSVVDAEAAKRVGDLDAWAILGVYYLGGGGADDAGFRAGMRGYALPDLAVTVQVTDDDIYHTNVMAGLTWFVGRTHSGNAPCGVLSDRFREPVWRNDFIATTAETTTRAAGNPLTDADTNALFNFIHVNSNAALGGDGTFENPFTTLAQAQGAQQDGSYVYVHSNSVLSGNFTPLDNVNVLGEGVNQDGDMVTHTVDSVELGTLTLPETSTGAGSLPAPIINGVGNVFTLANDNQINNFTINGGTNAVVGNGINAPQLANLDINTPTDTGLSFTGITGTAVVENTVTIDNAGNTGVLVDGGTDGMLLNARITDASGSSLIVRNRTGGTITYGGSIIDSGTDTDTAAGIVIEDNEDATINFTQVIDMTENLGININSGNFSALSITGNNVGTQITFAELLAESANADTVFMTHGGTLTINDANSMGLITNTGTGDAFRNIGNANTDFFSTITVATDITNSGGGNAVDISARADNNVSFSGDITDTDSEGISLVNNLDGTIAFNGLVTTNDSGANNGVTISGGGADVTYQFTDIVLNTTDGTGFKASGDGTLIVTSANGTNGVNASGTGSAVDIDGLTIGTGGAIFDTVSTSGSANEGVKLANLDGTAQVRIGSGTDPGDGGVIMSDGTGISINNANNVVVNNVRIDNSGNTGAGVVVTGQDAATDAVSLNGVEITTSGAANGFDINTNSDGTINATELVVTSEDGNAVNVTGNTGGTNIFTDLEATTTGTGTAVNVVNNTGTTTTINGMMLSATGTGNGLNATQKGTIAVTGDTEISVASGRAINLNDVTVDAAGVSIDKATVTGGTVDSVSLVNLAGTGAVTVGADTTDPGSITTTGRGVFIDQGTNNITVNTAVTANGAGRSLEVTNRTGGTVTYNSTTTDNATGMRIANNTGGTITVTDDLTFNTGANDSIAIAGNNGATVNFTDAGSIDLGTSSGNGVHLTGQNTNVSIAADIQGGTGTSVDIEGNATGNISGDITNTAGRSLRIHDLTAGTVNVSGNINDTGAGISVDNNSGGTVTVSGTSTLNTGANDALTVQDNTGGTFAFNNINATTSGGGDGVNVINNTGAEVTFSGMTINASGSGNGFTATGGGTLSATGTNNVTTATGTGVNINGMTIDGPGANFNRVNVNGATNGITLTNTTGGQIRVGRVVATQTDGDGGVINTTGSSIVLSGVTNAVFNDVTANADTGNAVSVTHTSSNNVNIVFDNLTSTTVGTSGNAVVVTDNGIGELDFTLTNSTIDTQVSNTVGFVFQAGNNGGEVDIRFTDNVITADGSSAFNANINQGTGDVQFLFTGNSLSNNDAADTAAFTVASNRTLNATIGTQGGGSANANGFTNGTGIGLHLTSNAAAARINLDLRGNTATGGGGIDYQLSETNGVFGVVDVNNTLTLQNQNIGTIDLDGKTPADFTNLAPPIKQVD